MPKKRSAAKDPKTQARTLLDLGSGRNKAGPEWTGVDRLAELGPDVVCDLGSGRWPWRDNSVDEARASHFVEHLTPAERIHFANELWRVLKPGAKATIVTPHWASARAYGDLTHQWPPVTSWWYFYLNKEWRTREAPHNTAYRCDFDNGWGHVVPQHWLPRHDEFRAFAMQNFVEGAGDLIATVTKRP